MEYIRPEIEDSFVGYDMYSDHPQKRNWIDENYERLTDYEKFWCTIEAYRLDGYQFPKKKIIRLKKIKPTDYLKNLDPALDRQQEITIYRGSGGQRGITIHRGSGTDTGAENEISWTTDRNVAIWFYMRRRNFYNAVTNNGQKIDYEAMITLITHRTEHPTCYQATINVDRIIATVEGTEREVIQHRGVKNIMPFTPTEDEIELALFQHMKQLGTKIERDENGTYFVLTENGHGQSGLELDEMAEALHLKLEHIQELLQGEAHT